MLENTEIASVRRWRHWEFAQQIWKIVSNEETHSGQLRPVKGRGNQPRTSTYSSPALGYWYDETEAPVRALESVDLKIYSFSVSLNGLLCPFRAPDYVGMISQGGARRRACPGLVSIAHSGQKDLIPGRRLKWSLFRVTKRHQVRTLFHQADRAVDAFTGGGRAFKFQNWPIKRTLLIHSAMWPILKFEHPTPEHRFNQFVIR